jgi:hypothetical protein
MHVDENPPPALRQSSSRNSTDIATNGEQSKNYSSTGGSQGNFANCEEQKSLSEEPVAQKRKIRGSKWMVVVVAILSSTFLFSLDNTVVADIQPTITRQFGSVDKLPWLSVGYLLGSTTTNLLWYVAQMRKPLHILSL